MDSPGSRVARAKLPQNRQRWRFIDDGGATCHPCSPFLTETKPCRIITSSSSSSRRYQTTLSRVGRKSQHLDLNLNVTHLLAFVTRGPFRFLSQEMHERCSLRWLSALTSFNLRRLCESRRRQRQQQHDNKRIIRRMSLHRPCKERSHPRTPERRIYQWSVVIVTETTAKNKKGIRKQQDFVCHDGERASASLL